MAVPAVTALNVPPGASACPKPLFPQQVMVASVLSPHVWSPPAVTALEAAVGRGACADGRVVGSCLVVAGFGVDCGGGGVFAGGDVG